MLEKKKNNISAIKILRKIHKRIIKNFLDILILAELRKGRSMSGHDFILLIQKKFRILISSGTAYSVLYVLERNGLTEGMWNGRKKVYKLTDKGEKTINIILNAKEKIQSFMTTLL